MTAPPTAVAEAPSLVLALVGLGPRGSGLLERLVSNAADVAQRRVEIHLVDPFPPGGGRIWRDAQSDLLRLNTTAEDLTSFVDDSVDLDGPVITGPTMFAWCRSDGVRLSDPELAAEAGRIGPLEFPSRRLASAYLAFAHQRAVDRAPASVEVITHRQRAVDLHSGPDGSRERLVLEDGSVLSADAVVILTSHTDVAPAAPFAALSDFADSHGLSYLPPGYGGDLDLSGVPAGEDVIVRGFGLGFVDLMILLTEGRGGRFVGHAGGVRYLPSGQEPHLWVGSRRGVPYHCKPMYRLQLPKPTENRFCTPAAIGQLLRRKAMINFRADVWPLIGREVSWAYYRELIGGHPGRVPISWTEFDHRFAELAWDGEEYRGWIDSVVSDPADRLDLTALDHPLAGLVAADREELSRIIGDYIRADLARRRDVAFSADLGAFHALLAVLPVVGPVLGSALLDPRSLRDDFTGWYLGFFNFFASGPPPDRLEQLLALEAAGVLSFLGGGLQIDADQQRGAFVARSSSVADEVAAGSMIEATLPDFDLSRTADPLLGSLARRGEIVSQVLTGRDGDQLDTGALKVDAAHRLVRPDGSSAPRRFALGMHTTMKSAAFARPGSNGPVHRQNDRVARTLLALDVADGPERRIGSPEPIHHSAAYRGTGGR